jgi:hypothetical protein
MTDSAPKIRTASCLCGALRATAHDAPRDVYVCACRNCQKKSGSAFTYAAIFSAEEVSVTGAHQQYRYTGDSGRWIENHFCPACGGYVFFLGEAFPGHIGINVGAMDEADFAPRRMYWTSRRHRWLGVPDGVEEVETQ